jgi:hypothetical protein
MRQATDVRTTGRRGALFVKSPSKNMYVAQKVGFRCGDRVVTATCVDHYPGRVRPSDPGCNASGVDTRADTGAVAVLPSATFFAGLASYAQAGPASGLGLAVNGAVPWLSVAVNCGIATGRL